jgi:hypothetical protein
MNAKYSKIQRRLQIKETDSKILNKLDVEILNTAVYRMVNTRTMCEKKT